jgi:hypothetical protein
MFGVCCVGSGLCDELSTYRVCVCVDVSECLIACDLETSTLRWPMIDLGSNATEKKVIQT